MACTPESLFQASNCKDLLPGLAERFSCGRYLEVGWGDNDFYQAGEKRTDHTLKALFWPTDSVVHMWCLFQLALPVVP